jgi:hypothetical protein
MRDAQEFVSNVYGPKIWVEYLTIRLSDGRQLKLPCAQILDTGLTPLPAKKIREEMGGITKPMRKVLLVMPDDGTPWPVAKIATATGYEEGPHLRTALAALVKMGLLANDNEGYRAV